jgi:hypothetical protein
MQLYLRYNYIMQFLHTSLGKSKKKKPNAKQRELQASWEAMLKKYNTKKVVHKEQSLSEVYSLGKPACRETPKHPSLPFTGAPCYKKPNPVYTGTAIKGIGTMHKSNAVPVFSDEQARDIATMRRG